MKTSRPRPALPIRPRDPIPITPVGVHVINVGGHVMEVEQVAVASARNDMPGLIRASAESGRAFLIHNAKNAAAATALLINPVVLGKLLAATTPRRTLAELIDTLPFKRRGSPRLEVEMSDDDAPALRVPKRRPDAKARAQTRVAKTG